MMVCVGVQGKKTKLLRTGIYLFAAMEITSAVGYRMFPLSDSSYAGALQDTMPVVLLSIVTHTLIIIAEVRNKSCRSYGICAGSALGMCWWEHWE